MARSKKEENKASKGKISLMRAIMVGGTGEIGLNKIKARCVSCISDLKTPTGFPVILLSHAQVAINSSGALSYREAI